VLEEYCSFFPIFSPFQPVNNWSRESLFKYMPEMSTDQDWIGLDQDWSQFWQDQDWIGLRFVWKLADQDWIGLRKFLLFWCDYSNHINNVSCDVILQICMVMYILPSTAKLCWDYFAMHPPLSRLHIWRWVCITRSKVNVVDMLVSVSAVRVFSSSM